MNRKVNLGSLLEMTLLGRPTSVDVLEVKVSDSFSGDRFLARDKDSRSRAPVVHYREDRIEAISVW